MNSFSGAGGRAEKAAKTLLSWDELLKRDIKAWNYSENTYLSRDHSCVIVVGVLRRVQFFMDRPTNALRMSFV